MIEFVEINAADLEYLWQNMRERDKSEMQLMGINDENFLSYWISVDGTIVHYEGKPIAFFFGVPTSRVVQLGFMATDAVNKIPVFFHKASKMIVQSMAEHWFGKRCICVMWAKYKTNRKWLEALGFAVTGHQMKFGGEVFQIFELR